MSWRPGQVRSALDGTELDLAAWPVAWFGAGVVRRLPEAVAGTGAPLAVVVTDAGLAATGLPDRISGLLSAAGLPATVFDGVHANPTTGDLAAGADAVRAAAGLEGPDGAEPFGPPRAAGGLPGGRGRRVADRRGQGHRGGRGQPAARPGPGLPQ